MNHQNAPEPPPGEEQYRIEWYGRDGHSEVRQYPINDVVIGTQDGSFVVGTQEVNSTVKLLVPVQRIIQVEVVSS